MSPCIEEHEVIKISKLFIFKNAKKNEKTYNYLV